MGKILDTLIGNEDTLNKVEPKSVDKTSINSNLSLFDLKIAEINTKKDISKVEKSIKNEDILIIQIKQLQNITKNEILNHLYNVVEDINGDMVEKNQSEYIITPNKINIHRSKI